MFKVEGLCKTYPKFKLNNVSFSIEKGSIVGFIGANGAGKTTTIKSMLNLIEPDSGKVTFLGKDYYANETELKAKLGFSLGAFDYYPKTKIKTLAKVESMLYPEWDARLYGELLALFELDENKRPSELSGGMKVKLGIALALSHGAELIILDEPTAGLDPAARDDLVDLFIKIKEEHGKSIIFSTHITSDLEKCADHIVFIKSGKVLFSDTKDAVLDAHLLINGKLENISDKAKEKLIGIKNSAFGFTSLIKTEDKALFDGLESARPTIDDLMVFYKEGEKNEK